MGALTPQFVMDLESRMQVIQENEYTRFAANMWWSRLMKRRPSSGRRELITFLLSTAMIEDFGVAGGKQVFEDLVTKQFEFENRYAGTGLKLRRAQLEDTDGGGIDLAAEWSAQVGQYMAYWPQKSLVSLIKNGATSGYNSYDAVTFFNTGHPTHPFNTAKGYYANVFTGASGAGGANANDPNKNTYPGAAPIDESVSLDTAFANIGKVCSYIRSIKMPNGDDPRFLRPTILMAGPRLGPRIAQLTGAKFIAQAASSGGGSADVEALIKFFGFAEPIVADELAGFESDTTYFIGCEQIGSSPIGSFIYSDREPFRVTYYTGQGGGNGVDAVLDRADELEWHLKGRNVSTYGHPYMFFKVKAT